MPDLFPHRGQGRFRVFAVLVGLVAAFYGLAHLWVTAGEPPPSMGPAPAALRPPAEGQAAESGASQDTTVAQAPATRAPAPPFREVADTLSPDRTVAADLAMHNVGALAVNELVESLRGVFDFRRARAGNRYALTLRTADARVTKFRFETGPLDVYEAERGTDGVLRGRKLDIPVRTEVAEIGAELQVSLYQAMKRAGESPALVSRLVDVFAWDIDFYKDPRPGDSFRVLVEKVYTGDRFIKFGRLLAAEYASQKRGTFRVYHWAPETKGKPGAVVGSGGAATSSGDAGGYFLDDGQSARKLFLKTPLKFARVSSKFDLHRKHPILGYTRAHLGTDYAARTGTPVWSMAGGVVRKAAFERGFGNLVIVDHKNGLLSFYAHLSRFAKGLKAGQAVEQKQLVGYVGMTGLATGPHLHFGVKRNGGWVNPEALKQTRGAPVPAKSLSAFKREVMGYKAHLDKISISRPKAPEPADDGPDEGADDVDAETPASPPEANNAPTSGALPSAPTTAVH